MDEVRDEAVTVPPEVLGDARAALVVRPGDRLVVLLEADTTPEAVDEIVDQIRTASPDLKGRVLVVAGAEQLAVLRGEVPA